MFKSLRWYAKAIAGQYPALLPLFRLYPRFQPLVFNARTQLVIEGFPRSANSFFFNYVRECEPALRIAHHIHSPAQILAALQREVPAVLLIREPAGAVASVVAVDERLTIGAALQGYQFFHRPLLPALSRLIVATFEEATNQPDQIVREVQSRFGVQLRATELDTSQRERIFARLRAHHSKERQPAGLLAVPDAGRGTDRALLRQRVVAHPDFSTADALYRRMLSTRLIPAPSMGLDAAQQLAGE